MPMRTKKDLSNPFQSNGTCLFGAFICHGMFANRQKRKCKTEEHGPEDNSVQRRTRARGQQNVEEDSAIIKRALYDREHANAEEL